MISLDVGFSGGPNVSPHYDAAVFGGDWNYCHRLHDRLSCHTSPKSTGAGSKLGTAGDGCILPELSGNGILLNLPDPQWYNQPAIPPGASQFVHVQHAQKSDVSGFIFAGRDCSIPLLHVPWPDRLFLRIGHVNNKNPEFSVRPRRLRSTRPFSCAVNLNH